MDQEDAVPINTIPVMTKAIARVEHPVARQDNLISLFEDEEEEAGSSSL